MLMIGILGIALFVLAVILSGFTWWVIRYMLIKLPERQQDILERFSPRVVNQIVMEYALLPQYQQKQIACERMRNIFDDERIARPGETMIEASIADALSQRKMKEADLWIEELKADQVAEASTMEMPVTPKEDIWVL